jgi:carboxyl-terminal processing protease
MKKILAVFISVVLFPVLSHCQTVANVANDAYLITRMVSKFHVDPRPVNKLFSENVYDALLKHTDAGRMLFTKEDIKSFELYRSSLDKEITQRKTAFLSLFVTRYREGLEQTDTLISLIAKKPFDFYVTENLKVAEDTSYPVNDVARQLKIYKDLKLEVLDELINGLPTDFKTFSLIKQKQYIDSAEVTLRKKAALYHKRRIKAILQNPYGIEQYAGNLYCEAIASGFDPHTTFFPPEQKEDFESELGQKPFMFGFKVKEGKNGGVVIEDLQPGSPAFKGGKLNKGDKFMALQWEGSKRVDVSDISEAELSALLDESNHKKILFTMKKTDGTLIQVPLEKEQVEDDPNSDRINSFVLKGNNNTIGYIYLPDFYEDWDVKNEGLNGCANDVGREILKLKKENINGLILDLRLNGGGSVEEATELAGIFIDAGPVAQAKGKEPKIYTLKDTNPGTVYDGPLVVLVNSGSASASELVAGTLQNYNRAVIIGSPTFGKATAQVVLPLDTTVNPETIANIKTKNYLKLTISKLYRVDGTTAQFNGVQPDIRLPDATDAFISREANEPFALRPTSINPNKYYKPYPPLPISRLAADVKSEIDTSSYFKTVRKLIADSKQQKVEKDVSLNIKDALADVNDIAKTEYNSLAADTISSKKFIVKNNSYEQSRLQADKELKQQNDDFSKQISADAYINIAYDVLSKLKNQ